MKRLLIAGALTLAAGLSACVTPTPYQPAQLTSRGPVNGFSEAPLEGNRWRVSFSGNSVTSREQVEDALLLRAAELTLQQGFEHFIAVNRATDREVRYSASPRFGSGFGSGFGYSRFGYPGWSPYWSAYGSRFGWRPFGHYGRFGGGFGFGYDPFFDDIDVREIDRYQASAEIVMGRGARPNDPLAFNAREVFNNLSPRLPRPAQPAPGRYRRY